MYIVQGVLISDLLFEKQFICHLSKCKGACCHEGDFGAPLSDEECELLNRDHGKVHSYLEQENIDLLQTQGPTALYSKTDKPFKGTSLMPSGACVFMGRDETGCAKCAIEQAHLDGKVRFEKPISCHLYPLRIFEEDDFVAINFDKWEICKAACALGEASQMPVFRFVKSALIRKFGEGFYDELEAAYGEWKRSQ